MKKKITTMVAAMAMSAMMAMSAFASNYTGPFFYFDAGQTQEAPAHAQGTITKVETADGSDEGTTDIAVYTQEITVGTVTGSISSITINGETQEPDANGVIAFEGVDDSLIGTNGLVQTAVTLSYSGHPVDLGTIYLDVIN